MGGIFSRKKKPEPTTLEKLEKIEAKIKGLDNKIQDDRRREKKIWATFLFSTGFVYVSVAGFLHVFVLKRETILDYGKLVCIWLAPIVIIYFILQRFIPWYFSRGIQENRENLKKLRDEKKKILDNVRETEPYNKAKTILEKYEGPQNEPPKQKPVANPQPRQSLPYQKMPITPFPGTSPNRQMPPPPYQQQQQPQGSPMFPVGRPPQMRDRGAFDRVLDYIVKDGPENRMALICRRCGAHNGLCLLDEYDFTGFRCFECHLPNAPRKPRPYVAASVPYPNGSRMSSISSVGAAPSLDKVSSSGSESGSSSGTETEGGSRHPPGGGTSITPLYKVTVKQPVLVTAEDADVPVQSVSAISENLMEGDTGSESGDEMETSTGDAAAQNSSFAVADIISEEL